MVDYFRMIVLYPYIKYMTRFFLKYEYLVLKFVNKLIIYPLYVMYVTSFDRHYDCIVSILLL